MNKFNNNCVILFVISVGLRHIWVHHVILAVWCVTAWWSLWLLMSFHVVLLICAPARLDSSLQDIWVLLYLPLEKRPPCSREVESPLGKTAVKSWSFSGYLKILWIAPETEPVHLPTFILFQFTYWEADKLCKYTFIELYCVEI